LSVLWVAYATHSTLKPDHFKILGEKYKDLRHVFF
jgi:hypothetical protein